MNIIDDFEDIARRVNRKPEPVVSVAAGLGMEEQAAIRTLKSLGYTYAAGAEMWKPEDLRSLLSKSFDEACAIERLRNKRHWYDMTLAEQLARAGALAQRMEGKLIGINAGSSGVSD